jgi:hypothetical protein
LRGTNTESYLKHITPCLPNTKTNCCGKWSKFVHICNTNAGGGGDYSYKECCGYVSVRISKAIYHMPCYPECSIPVQIRYLAGVGHTEQSISVRGATIESAFLLRGFRYRTLAIMRLVNWSALAVHVMPTFAYWGWV